MDTIALTLNVIGLTMLFIGNSLVTYTVGKWGGRNMKQFKIGNVVQSIGFIMSLVAIFMSVSS